MKKSIVVIPTYNEIENIENIINAVLNVNDQINVLVVDDNSPDGTSQKVIEMKSNNPRIHLITRAGKMGLGTAYCEGFQYALDNNFDYIMEMDADFSHNPDNIPRFLEEIEHNDLVIGSRYISGVNVVNWPLRRLILSYGSNLYARIITGIKIKDVTGGFKCFRAEYLKKINLKSVKSNGYSFQVEMNYRMWKLGARIKEISIIFIDRRSGKSKMSKKNITEAIWMVWKLKFGLYEK